MPRTKGNTTKLVRASPNSDSLKVTVPSFIVKALHLVSGDDLEWDIESLSEGLIRVIIVKEAR